MIYQKCRDCKYRCNCCSGRYTLCRCSGCENHYDEFRLAENIIYCSLDGSKLDTEITLEEQISYIPICEIDCNGVCYDCPNKWTTTHCGNEDKKYNVIIDKIKRVINEYGDKKFWISVNWDETDAIAMRAWERAKKWLKDNGYKCTGVTYREWIQYRTDGKPCIDIGCHHGTAYIRKEKL